MLLSLVLILLLIGAAVVGSLYSNFIVFYKSFSETDSYNKAYYASIAALERGELVTKQREPGYRGSGGWIGITGVLLGGDSSDQIDSGFSYLVKSDDTSVLRDVNSRTGRIPRTGEGDVDWMLSAQDSTNYNKMDYENAEVFLLYVDNLVDSPYKKKSCNDGDCYDVKVGIEGQIRLPPKMVQTFGRLDTTKSPNIRYNQNNKDDEIVDWQLRGNYDGKQFTIFSYNKNDSWKHSVIKESDVNGVNGVNLEFGKNEKRRQPISTTNSDAPLIVVSSKAKEIDSNRHFSDILRDNRFSGLNLRLSLLNILQAETSGMIYPYLEYYLDFTDDVADKYFKINGEGKYKDYQVNIIMHKPTIKESVLGNFTAIF